MYFALDANVWLSEKLLRSAVGVAFVHAVRRLDARLLLPDSTREEILVGVVAQGVKAATQVDSGLLTIQALTGTRPEVVLPDATALRTAANARLEELASLLAPCEITVEHFSRALSRVNEHRPPAATREQYRDCLLWECLIDYHGDRVLVSGDSDFLDKSGGSKQLAPELVAEAGASLAFCTSLKDALRAVEPQLPPIDVEATTTAIEAATLQILLECRESWPFVLVERVGAHVELYATEQASTTTVVFDLSYRIRDFEQTDGVVVPEGIAHIKGECLLGSNQEITNLQMDRIDFLSLDGAHLRGGVAYLRASSSGFGVRQVPYAVRAPVPFDPA